MIWWRVAMMALPLAGCVATLKERLELAPNLAHNRGWGWQIVAAGPFDLAVAVSPATGPLLTVYVEGDGLAFINAHQPSTDPTPNDPVALRLALAQPAGGLPVAWVGRPCQYSPTKPGRNCRLDYWTSARYAPVVVDSLGLALDQLKRQTHADRVVLVGYSGGGAVATLLAAQRGDVAGLVTINANLDVDYWTHRDGLTPLDQSLDPARMASQLGHVPQYHFSGGKDKNVGPDVTLSFASHLPVGTPLTLQTMADFDHHCCWAQSWGSLWPQVTSRLQSQGAGLP